MNRLPAKLVCLIGLGVCACAVARAAEPEHVEALVKGGATQLALRVLESEQKSNLPPDEWVRWERQRFAVLRALRRWDELTKRVERLPENVPADFRREALDAAVDARLAVNDTEGARRYLRRQLWGEHLSGADAARARRLIIRSYVQEERLDDAQAALLRYQQDYQAKTEPWQVLHAEILLQADDPRGALKLLVGLQSYEARLLRLTAALRAKQQRPRDVMTAANQLAGGLGTRPELQRGAWILSAEAALTAGDDEARVLALERALALPNGGASPLFRAEADDLWQAYDRLAESIGNAGKLLVGNDDDWLNKAESIPCTEHHVARAQYAFLSRNAEAEEVRALSHRRLALGLMRDGRSVALESLYTRSQRYPSVARIPPQVRYALADKAIADYNIRLAAELVRGLDSPPEGEAPEDWALRRARILVYAGEYRAAAELLQQLLRDQETLDADLTARLLQVLFDLQAVNRHAEALRLLGAVYDKIASDKLRREILYWMADSQNGLKQYDAAAELYLRSATFGGASGEDPWGQSARLLAGEALGRAGLTDDARQVYLKLLATASDPRQRAQIERQMQQLWLGR